MGWQEFDFILLHLYGAIKASDKVQHETGRTFEVSHALKASHEPTLCAIIEGVMERNMRGCVGDDIRNHLDFCS